MGNKRPWDTRRIRLQKLLREIREEAGLNQVKLAERLKRDQSFVSRYERGERRLDLVELADISKACGIELNIFVRRFSSKDK
jgi:transcriptional regulator with XRE-family HTH domain